MSLKQKAKERQDGKSADSGKPLPEEEALYDARRKVSRVDGGKYESDNIEVVEATETRDSHDNTPWLTDPDMVHLRAIMEDYRVCVKMRVKVVNYGLAVARRMDEVTPDIEEMFDSLLAEVEPLQEHFKKMAMKQLRKVDMPIIPVLMGIKGIGPISAAEIVTLMDIRQAKHASSFWKFVGYHTASKDRYVKGQKGGGHKHLRSVMYNVGVSLLRAGNEDYTDVYYRRKAKTENSEKTVLHKSGKGKDYEETAWKDVNPGRRHADALRIMIKHFLGDLWFVWRTLEGLPTSKPYVEVQLGHDCIIRPSERGWEY